MLVRLHSFYAFTILSLPSPPPLPPSQLYSLPSHTRSAGSFIKNMCFNSLLCMLNVDAEAQTHSVSLPRKSFYTLFRVNRCMAGQRSTDAISSLLVRSVASPSSSSCAFGDFGRIIHTITRVRARLFYARTFLCDFFLLLLFSFYFSCRSYFSVYERILHAHGHTFVQTKSFTWSMSDERVRHLLVSVLNLSRCKRASMAANIARADTQIRFAGRQWQLCAIIYYCCYDRNGVAVHGYGLFHVRVQFGPFHAMGRACLSSASCECVYRPIQYTFTRSPFQIQHFHKE